MNSCTLQGYSSLSDAVNYYEFKIFIYESEISELFFVVNKNFKTQLTILFRN